MAGAGGVDWNAGSVFGVIWAAVTLPIMAGGTALFWRNRDIQPIRARSPLLVVITDIILFLYTLLLCIQRIMTNDYPCILNLWSGYVGTIVLFNSYLWRCQTQTSTPLSLSLWMHAAAGGRAKPAAGLHARRMPLMLTAFSRVCRLLICACAQAGRCTTISTLRMCACSNSSRSSVMRPRVAARLTKMPWRWISASDRADAAHASQSVSKVW